MGREIGYCGVCGIRVQAAGDQGVLSGGRLYCSACLPEGPYDPRPMPEVRPATPRPLPRVRATTKKTRRRKPSALIAAASLLAAVLGAVAWAAGGAPPPEPVQTPPATIPNPKPGNRSPEGLRPPEPGSGISDVGSIPPSAAPPRLEEEAQELYGEFEETALGLAQEGRFDGAFRKIDAFPERLRTTRAWKSLEALRRSIESRR